MKYKSPLCSCIVCRTVKSACGIHGHYFSTHDPEGIKIMAEVRSLGTDATFRNPEFVKNNKQEQIKKLPNKIKHKCDHKDCSNLTSNSKFCSRRCSVIVNNRKRTESSYEKQSDILIKNKNAPELISKEKVNKERKKTKRVCVVCGKIEFTTGRFQSKKCSFCNDSLTYRRQCEFKFNLKDYPEEFDFELLSEHGMFHPKKNPKGVSRDHMLSVQYGKSNRIPSHIISHPANCRLILQGDNTRKQSDCCLSYDELLDRIKIWNDKYNRVAEPGFEPELALNVSGL